MEIEKLIKLTPEQENLCKEMEACYLKMQQAGIAFAVNENAEVVVYNSNKIRDCESKSVFNEVPDGYEEVYQDDMRALFPVWNCETLCVKRK